MCPEPCYCFKRLVKSLSKIDADVEYRKDEIFRVRIKNREIFDFIRSLIKGIKKDKRVFQTLIVMFDCEGSFSYSKKRRFVKDAKEIQQRKKESVIKFTKNIGTLKCFRVGRGKFKGWRKSDLLKFLMKEYLNTLN